MALGSFFFARSENAVEAKDPAKSKILRHTGLNLSVIDTSGCLSSACSDDRPKSEKNKRWSMEYDNGIICFSASQDHHHHPYPDCV